MCTWCGQRWLHCMLLERSQPTSPKLVPSTAHSEGFGTFNCFMHRDTLIRRCQMAQRPPSLQCLIRTGSCNMWASQRTSGTPCARCLVGGPTRSSSTSEEVLQNVLGWCATATCKMKCARKHGIVTKAEYPPAGHAGRHTYHSWIRSRCLASGRPGLRRSAARRSATNVSIASQPLT
jgi:hypothetical protein